MQSILRLFVLANVLFASFFLGCVLSAEPVAERPILTAVYGDFAPYQFTAEDGSVQGYNADVTRMLAERAGYDVAFTAAENPRQFLDMLARGEVDLTPFMALTPARRRAGLATLPLGEYVLAVYVRQDTKIREIGSLSGRKIGVVAGAITQTAAKLISENHIVEFRNSDDLLLPLLNGELDAVVSVAETFDARLRAHFMEDKIRRLKPPLAIIPYGLLVRRELPDVHAALNDAIEVPATPDILETLRAQWFGRDRSIVHHPWFGNVALIVGGIAMTTVALGVYAIRLRRRSAVLLVENGQNQLLIDALDNIRAAIIIFDSDMKAVNWNAGFKVRFPLLVPELRRAATMQEAWMYAHKNEMFATEMTQSEMGRFAATTAARLRAGKLVQRNVLTSEGNTFDLTLFRLGSGHFAAIWVDVTEVHLQNERIATQGEELSRKNQQLLAFSAMAAHDLKAPLVQQVALLNFILEDVADAQIKLPAEVQSNIAILENLSNRMRSLVGDLLEYAKADFDAAPSVCFAPDARFENILTLSAVSPAITVTIKPDICPVRVNPNAFDMVMRNLITNAAKHNDRIAGHIILRGHKRGEHVTIEVEDDGPGIAAEKSAQVFEPFCRLTKVEGTGLGLAFVKKTVAGWGGTINVRAGAKRGCIVSVTMPAASTETTNMLVARTAS
ncbi:transporter substrate-binding domain-containing protein [Sulfitobacter sp. F26169L]|uniref:ATP-binding protein n=1 Tax=Sulfitobacter sp. F26169L TaxID=2996015 RepID=UPI002260E542|nr:transporter substrate-binding domain-containing protein [Sulfitobacter sp. F26169L]MCX7567262.1 transporter substrate-binding domain-containing protein [Sulfitobacter sp. F26169L]